MDDDVQLPEPVVELLDAAAAVAPVWLRRVTSSAAGRGGLEVASLPAGLDEMVAEVAAQLDSDLRSLLATDVDRQRTNPLSLFRAAVGRPTEWLLAAGVSPPPGDAFASEHFPDDPFRLGPASWSDIDPSLQDAGLTWGAWKAMTVLQRRRDEGMR